MSDHPKEYFKSVTCIMENKKLHEQLRSGN